MTWPPGFLARHRLEFLPKGPTSRISLLKEDWVKIAAAIIFGGWERAKEWR
jgi:hypothetical protein